MHRHHLWLPSNSAMNIEYIKKSCCIATSLLQLYGFLHELLIPPIFVIYAQIFKHNQQFLYCVSLTVLCECPETKCYQIHRKCILLKCFCVRKRYESGKQMEKKNKLLLLCLPVVKILLLNLIISIYIYLLAMSVCSREKNKEKWSTYAERNAKNLFCLLHFKQ